VTAAGARRFPTAAPDGLVAAVLLSFLATAGFFYVNIMAALVAGLVDGLGFSAGDAGRVGSLNIYGAAAGALVAVALVARIAWRPFAACALLALIAIDAASIFVTTPHPLMAMRFLHGMVGGMLVGVSYGVFARTRSPDRVFGMLLVVQYGLGGLGIMMLPKLVPVYGHGVLFGALMAFSAVTLLMLPFLDDYPRGRIERPAAAGGIQKGLLAAAVGSVFLFQAGNMGLAAYMLGLAKHAGIDAGYASTALGVATWIGIAGSGLVVAFGTRFGRTWPLLASAAITVLGTLAFHWSGSKLVYLVANCVTAITWSFAIAYLLGLCAAFDPSGRTAALGGFLSKMGLASGPFVAAWLLDFADYAMLINVSAVALVASVPAMLVPARALDRSEGDAPLHIS
jgi:MFS transporter, DHA1 family, inner membrane transport protein